MATHYGKRSWWNGTVQTLCGLKLSAEARYEWRKATCRTCQRMRASGNKWGR
jgi:hypothetical protein